MKWIKNNINWLLSISFMLITLTVFGPIELYLTNSAEFWFDFKEMLKVSGILAAVAGVVLLTIGMILRGKARSLFSALVFILTLCLYIQGNFLNIDYGVLDGRTIDWSLYAQHAVTNTVCWIVCITALFLLWWKKPVFFERAAKIVSLFIIAVQILTLGVLAFSTDILSTEKGSRITTDHMMEIGSEDNIVIFVLDTFDDPLMDSLMDTDGEYYKTLFTDFTRFTDCAASGATTAAAMPMIISAEYYSDGLGYTEYVNSIFNTDGLYDALKRQNYNVAMYTDSTYIGTGANGYVANFVEGAGHPNSYMGLAYKYSSFTLFKYMPHVLKQYFWLYTGEFNAYKPGESYITDDAAFYDKLVTEKLQVNGKNSFRLIHLMGPHYPYTINEFAQPDEEATRVQQAKGNLYIVEEYINQMKACGVYDDAMIIITADHGDAKNYSAPILFVKDRGTSGNYEENDAPVSHIDLHPTLFSYLGKDAGETFFEIPEDQPRERMFYLRVQDAGSFYMHEYLIDDKVAVVGRGTATGNKLSPTTEITPVVLGEKMIFGLGCEANQYVVSGFDSWPTDSIISTGIESVFSFPLEVQPTEALDVEIDIPQLYDDDRKQSVKIFANGELVHKEEVMEPKTIQFTIPAEKLESQTLELKLQYATKLRPLYLSGITIGISTGEDPTYKLGTKLGFGLGGTGTRFCVSGISSTEPEDFSWTDDKEALFRLKLNEIPENDLVATLNIGQINEDFSSQMVEISVNEAPVYSTLLTDGADLRFAVPKEYVTGDTFELKLMLPNAICPAKILVDGNDRRTLGLAITGLTVEEYDPEAKTKEDTSTETVTEATEELDFDIEIEKPVVFGQYNYTKEQIDVVFGEDGNEKDYILSGVGASGAKNFAWTDSKRAELKFDLNSVPASDVVVAMNIVASYDDQGPQQVQVCANGTVCFDEVVTGAQVLDVTIPQETFLNDTLLLTLNMPNAAAPADLTGEGDRRKLSLAMTDLTVNYTSAVGVPGTEIIPEETVSQETLPEETVSEEEDGFSIVDIVAIPLTALMQLCHNVLGNYILSIVVFTLLSKVILLPVSLWVQKNGITMVKITPEVNQIKIKYFGDKDSIDDETQALYKREKYNPLASTVPMIVQIVMLLGVIGAVKNLLTGADSVLTLVPSEAGGLTYLMPLAAGAAALALGIAQNHLNPLQREQSKKEQWMSNGFSIAISLFLGVFVSLGVGIYWVASNLLSILQQLLLNVLIRPEKHIDYEALEQSKKELAGLDSLSAEVSKEDKKREQADYKRFFSVANKHLVIYSEKSGFYKYYKDVMDFMLKYSNVIIHYVTNDPKDQIFKIAESQPRIKPYYISEKKLITLLMKMDADIVVMTCPDLDRYHLKRSYVRKDIEYVYMFHYPLSTHMVLNTGALDHYDTILCVGDFQFEEIRAAERLYMLPEKKLISAGYGQLEQLHSSYQKMGKVKRDRPKILIAPSWQQDNILDSCIDPLLDQLLDKGYEVVVRPHPEYVKRYKPRMDAIVQRYSGHKDLIFELDFTSNDSLFNSDIIISDWSGSAYEFSLVTLKPAVFVNTPPKINNPEYDKLNVEPLEFKLRGEVGIQIDPKNMEGLDQEINKLLENSEAYADQIKQIRDKYIANFGRSGEVGGKYILSQLLERQKKK